MIDRRALCDGTYGLRWKISRNVGYQQPRRTGSRLSSDRGIQAAVEPA